jgi:hypothetical protein
MMHKLLIVITLILFFSGLANAIDRMPEPKLYNKLFNADLVMHARVLKIENIIHEDDPVGAPDLKYFLDVIKVYRGKTGKNLIVISEMGKHNVKLETGKEYILFPSISNDGTAEIWNDLGEVGGGIIYSRKMELKIEKLLLEKDSIIEGEVRDRNWKLIPGAILTVTGNGVSKNVRVDKNGFFYIEVTPGTYEIEIPKNLRVSVNSPDGMSSDPKNDEVAPQTLVGGQCVQIQLIERQ